MGVFSEFDYWEKEAFERHIKNTCDTRLCSHCQIERRRNAIQDGIKNCEDATNNKTKEKDNGDRQKT